MGILSGISLICFAASYAVAWLIEVWQLSAPSTLRRGLALGFVLAGLVAHTLYLAYRAFELSASPLSSSFDWCLVTAWLLMARTCIWPITIRARAGVVRAAAGAGAGGRGGAGRSHAL